MKLRTNTNLIFLLAIAFLMHALPSFGQHPTPVRMLYQPRDNFFALTGAGGGNLYGLFKASGAASGVLSLDGNFNLGEKVAGAKNKLSTLGITFKIHPFINTLLENGDSIDVRRFVFQDNDFRVMLGGRYTLLSEKDKNPNARSKQFIQAFFDMIIVPYKAQGTMANGDETLSTLSLNAGGKFGFLTNVAGGLFGITANPQLDLLFVLDKPNLNTFEDITKANLATATQLARGYLGTGLKIEIPLNDFMLSFDIRKYFKMGSGEAVDGLTDNVLFSIGGVAMGGIFKNKDKKKDKMK